VKKKGILIYIEGLDGSGKTTHAHKLVSNLNKKGLKSIYTTEPSRGVIGKFIRETILEGKNRVPRVVEAVLFGLDRFEHFEKDLKPALSAGKIVISDRSVYSSLAYQGATGLKLDWIKEINKFCLEPDLAIFIDVPPPIVVKRIRRKKSVMEKLEIQKKVREVYIKFVKEGKLTLINGNKTKGEVQKSILKVVLKSLDENN
jgi:dTMP kinase